MQIWRSLLALTVAFGGCAAARAQLVTVSSPGLDRILDVYPRNADEAWVAGFVSGPTSCGTKPVRTWGMSDGLVALVSMEKGCIRAVSFGGDLHDYAIRVGVLPGGEVAMLGTCRCVLEGQPIRRYFLAVVSNERLTHISPIAMDTAYQFSDWALTTEGDIILAFAKVGTVPEGHGAVKVLRVRPPGHVVWSREIHASGNGNVSSLVQVTDCQDDVVVSVSATTPLHEGSQHSHSSQPVRSGRYQLTVLRLRKTDASVLQTTALTAEQLTNATGTVCDARNNLFVAGYYSQRNALRGVVLRFDRTGYRRTYVEKNFYIQSVATASGRLLLAGLHALGHQPALKLVVLGGSSPSIGMRRFGGAQRAGPGPSQSARVAVKSGAVFVVGAFTDLGTFGSRQARSNGDLDGYAWKIPMLR